MQKAGRLPWSGSRPSHVCRQIGRTSPSELGDGLQEHDVVVLGKAREVVGEPPEIVTDPDLQVVTEVPVERIQRARSRWSALFGPLRTALKQEVPSWTTWKRVPGTARQASLCCNAEEVMCASRPSRSSGGSPHIRNNG